MTFPSTRTEKSRPSFSRHAVFLLLTAVLFAPELQGEGTKQRSGRPVLYNLIVKEGDPVDQVIRERYGAKYDLIEVRNRSSYRSPKLTKTRFPNPVYDANNVEITGSVRVCFVVTADGRLVDPFILGQANPLLQGPVLEVLKQFRTTPARVNGAPAAAVYALKFTFGPPPRRRLDTP